MAESALRHAQAAGRPAVAEYAKNAPLFQGGERSDTIEQLLQRALKVRRDGAMAIRILKATKLVRGKVPADAKQATEEAWHLVGGINKEWEDVYRAANVPVGAAAADIERAVAKLRNEHGARRPDVVDTLGDAILAHAKHPKSATPLRVPAPPCEGVPAWVIEPALVVNLARRPERWDALKAHVKGIVGLACERVDAVDARTLDPEVAASFPLLHPNEAACLLSHVKALRRARERKARSVLILEDDARFLPGALVASLRAFQALPDDWDVFYLGGMHYQDPLPVDESAGLKYCTLCFGMHAYVVNGASLERVARILECSTSPCDVELAQASRDATLRCFCVAPSVATQAAGYSDIRDVEIPPWYAEVRHLDVKGYDYDNDTPIM